MNFSLVEQQLTDSIVGLLTIFLVLFGIFECIGNCIPIMPILCGLLYECLPFVFECIDRRYKEYLERKAHMTSARHDAESNNGGGNDDENDDDDEDCFDKCGTIVGYVRLPVAFAAVIAIIVIYYLVQPDKFGLQWNLIDRQGKQFELDPSCIVVGNYSCNSRFLFRLPTESNTLTPYNRYVCSTFWWCFVRSTGFFSVND